MKKFIGSSRKIMNNENVVGFMFVLPSLICLLFLCILPIVLSLIISFTDWNIVSGFKSLNFIGLDNYNSLFKDDTFWTSLKNNIYFTLMTIPLKLILGFFIAVTISKLCYFKNMFKIIYFLPYISSTVAIATVWMVLFQPSYGPINEALRAIGISNPPMWLGDMKWALPSIAVMYVWQTLGYIIIIYIAGIQAIPTEL